MDIQKEINALFTALKRYYQGFMDGFFSDNLWLPILIAVLFYFLLTFMLSKFRNITVRGSHTFHLFRVRIISCSITGLFIVGVSCYLWLIDFEGLPSPGLEFGLLMSYVIMLSIAFQQLYACSASFAPEKFKNVARPAVTESREVANKVRLIQSFHKARLWPLIGALGFIVLAFISPRFGLVSIVLDTSGSMGDGRFQKGRESLGNTLNAVDPVYNDFVLSVSPYEDYEDGCKPYVSLEEIFSSVDPDDFCTYSEVFLDEVPGDLIANLETDGNEYLIYAIWQNYLLSRQLVEDNLRKYDVQLMLVISDFEDGEDIKWDAQICNATYNFDDFYQDNAYLVNLREDGSLMPFASMFADCYPGNVLAGYNLTDYDFALQGVLEDLKARSWHFIIWLVLLFLVFGAASLLINPKKS
ncbi:MAG: hypothetical protein AAFN93_14645 [Bacteroidota bacterium]